MRASEKTRRLTGLALMTAIVIVLQLVASALVRVGVFAPTLTLAPILIGAAIYGPKAGAYLGGVFGVVVTITCIIGWDAGGNALWNANPFLTALICIVKGVAAGLAAGLVYRAVVGDSLAHGRMIAGSVAAGIVSPVVNTGIFLLGLFFQDAAQCIYSRRAAVEYREMGRSVTPSGAFLRFSDRADKARS